MPNITQSKNTISKGLTNLVPNGVNRKLFESVFRAYRKGVALPLSCTGREEKNLDNKLRVLYKEEPSSQYSSLYRQREVIYINHNRAMAHSITASKYIINGLYFHLCRKGGPYTLPAQTKKGDQWSS